MQQRQSAWSHLINAPHLPGNSPPLNTTDTARSSFCGSVAGTDVPLVAFQRVRDATGGGKEGGGVRYSMP